MQQIIEANPLSYKQRHWIMLGLSLSILVSSLATSMSNVALPHLTQVFNASMQAVQWVVIAYLLVITSLVVSLGRLGDILGNRRMLLIGMFIFALASLLCAIANTLIWLVLARALQGLGAAIMLALSMALMSKTQQKSGRAMGVWGSMSAAGTALGPALGGMSLSLFGWQSLFLLTLPLTLVAFFILYRALPTEQVINKEKAQLDVKGNLLLSLSLTFFALAMTLNPNQLGPLNMGLFGMAILGILLFFQIEKTQSSPLIPPQLVQQKAITLGFINCAITASVVMTSLILGPYYLSISLGLSEYQFGLVMSTGPIMVALSGVPAGYLVDKIGARNLTFMGLILMLTGCIFMSANSPDTGVFGYIFALITITLGFSFSQTANNTDLMSQATSAHKGVMSGLLNLARNLGFITGATLMSSLFFYFIGKEQLLFTTEQEVTQALQGTFLVAAGLVFFPLFFSLRKKAQSQ